MSNLSRRQFMYFAAAAPFLYNYPVLAARIQDTKSINLYATTRSILQDAYLAEVVAHKYYVRYSRKALDENFANIAYLFYALSFSEKIHADNYKRILEKLGNTAKTLPSDIINVADTKYNLQIAAEKELVKIESTYPHFLTRLETEDFEEAIISCMYSWKSHRQHEEQIREVLRYSGIFLGALASEIEGMKLDFHVCKVCGSTIDEEPKSPCIICNRSMSNYRKVQRPA